MLERDGSLELRVCDVGRGVPQASIARSLARDNGGEAWYEPNQPTGACFCVRVPRMPPPT